MCKGPPIDEHLHRFGERNGIRCNAECNPPRNSGSRAKIEVAKMIPGFPMDAGVFRLIIAPSQNIHPDLMFPSIQCCQRCRKAKAGVYVIESITWIIDQVRSILACQS